MAEVNKYDLLHAQWEECLRDEDRKMSNHDRRYRYHNKSFEAMGDKTVGRETLSKCIPADESIIHESTSFLNGISDPNLRAALRKLNSKQCKVIELIFWNHFNQQEASEILNCSQSNISQVLNSAIAKLKKILLK